MSTTVVTYTKPDKYLIDAGIWGIGATPTAIGATRGGLTWDPGITRRNVPFDGKSTDIAGNDRVTEYNSHLRGKSLSLSSTNIMRYEPGSTSDGSSGTNTITPIDARKFLQTGDYLQDVFFIGSRSDGKLGRVHAAWALVEKYSVTTKDNDEAEVDVDIKFVLGPTETNLNKCPYVWEEFEEP